MQLITLNIWGGRLNDELLDFVKGYSNDTDIFCFQEVYKEASGKVPKDYTGNLNIFKDLQKTLPSHTGIFTTSISDYYGVATFVNSKLEIADHGSVSIYQAENYQGGGNHSRNANYTKIIINDKEYLVFNLHGLWTGKGKGDDESRILQSQLIRKFTDEYDSPKIICGDFNLNPDTESLKLVAEGMNNLIAEYNITKTRTSYYDKKEKYADYIFTSPEIKVNDFKVLPEVASDHAALQLDFE